MTDHPLDRSPICRAVHDAVRQAEIDDRGVSPDDLPSLVGYPNPTEAEREVVENAVDELKAYGELIDHRGTLYTAESLNGTHTDENTADADETNNGGLDHAAAAVRAVTAADSTTGAPRSLVEATVGEAEVAEALRRGDVYAVGDRLKVTRRRA